MANSNAGPAALADPRARAAALATQIGRFQSPELWQSATQAMTAPVRVQLSRQMPLNRPAESIIVKLAGRITVANANMTAVVPEAIQNLIQLITLNGAHRRYGNLTPWRISGATAFAILPTFQAMGNDLVINGVRAASPGKPFVSPFLGNVGTYDFVLTLNLPLGPIMGIGQSTKRDLSAFVYQAADWGDSIQLQLDLGDASSLGTPTTAGDVTLTAFGSAAGSPTWSVFVNYSILGDFANGWESGVIVRQEQLFNTFVTAGNALRISQLQKQITPNVLIKSGTSLAGVTAGINAFATLTDDQLNRTMIMVDNKPLKFNQDNLVLKSYYDRMFNAPIPEGYTLISFVEAQSPLLAYRGDGLAGGSLFELQSDVLTTGATQILSVTQEMAYGGPYPALR